MGVRVSLALIIFREWRVFAVQQNRATFLPSSFTAVQSNPISLRAKAAESGGGGVRERERESRDAGRPAISGMWIFFVGLEARIHATPAKEISCAGSEGERQS